MGGNSKSTKPRSDKRRSGRSESSKSKGSSSRAELHVNRLFIVVYRGDPTDHSYLRHTALFVSSDEGAQSSLLHAIGEPGNFEFEEVWGARDPAESQTFVGLVEVSVYEHQDVRVLQDCISGTRIRNDQDTWDCQTFVTDALKRLKRKGHLHEDDFLNGFEGMMDMLETDNNLIDDDWEE
ncbi:unnamed protein product [Clonostachys rosea f. rosea IK726]|uniref:Uncharacterized protein n=1 Tax=Clonostachys rosea f. rosea IK726 TaxID=1349383 RepID=A0ACA9UVL6_BIOOC|nr:unnamed protein product [Clonostachys rosea f. rosea IK726]